MKSKGMLIVVSAPSGGGKTTICDNLLRQDRRLIQSISVTTREPRGREKNGREYIFVRPSEFDRWRREDRFLEWAEVHGYCYGTLKRTVDKHRQAGRDVLLVIDVQGGKKVKQQEPGAILVFIRPPSLQVLRQRLAGRGTDSPADIRRRLQNARGELQQAEEYDYWVVNRELMQATTEVQAIIKAERLRVSRQSRQPAGKVK